jgi:hypothetical protein
MSKIRVDKETGPRSLETTCRTYQGDRWNANILLMHFGLINYFLARAVAGAALPRGWRDKGRTTSSEPKLTRPHDQVHQQFEKAGNISSMFSRTLRPIHSTIIFIIPSRAGSHQSFKGITMRSLHGPLTSNLGLRNKTGLTLDSCRTEAQHLGRERALPQPSRLLRSPP